jgi:hypothetical protein
MIAIFQTSQLEQEIELKEKSYGKEDFKRII